MLVELKAVQKVLKSESMKEETLVVGMVENSVGWMELKMVELMVVLRVRMKVRRKVVKKVERLAGKMVVMKVGKMVEK
jgi:hypothetical protein